VGKRRGRRRRTGGWKGVRLGNSSDMSKEKEKKTIALLIREGGTA